MKYFQYEMWFHSNIGVIHTILALIAMVLGSIVLLSSKGTTKHKRIGYAYVCSMLVMCVTSFWMHTFGTFGVFHFASVLSMLTITGGMIPAIRRKNSKWLVSHFYFMSWSVVGLYAAFFAEIGTRMLDMRYFWWAVAIATFVTVFLGSKIINGQAKKRFAN